MRKVRIITIVLIVAITGVAAFKSLSARAELVSDKLQFVAKTNPRATALLSPPTCTGLSYASRTTFATGDAPTSVARGDFNGDGKPDVAVANISSNNVSVLLGDGAGGFSPAVNFNAREMRAQPSCKKAMSARVLVADFQAPERLNQDSVRSAT
jgi:FG-GAP-like repeat